MKKQFFLIIFCSLISLSGFSQYGIIDCLKWFNYNNITYNSTISPHFIPIEASKNSLMNLEYSKVSIYDTLYLSNPPLFRGKVRSISTSQSYDTTSRTIYSFNENGLLETSMERDNQNKISFSQYKRNDNGDVTEYISSDINNTKKYTNIYNNNNKLIKITAHDQNNKYLEVQHIEYNTNGNYTKIKIKDNKDVVQFFGEYLYNNKNQLIQSTIYNRYVEELKIQDQKTTYKYDTSGHLIEANVYFGEKPRLYYKTMNTYNKKGYLEKTQNFKYYTRDTITKEYSYYANGIVKELKINNSQIIKYDEKGNTVSNYYSDLSGNKVDQTYTYIYDKNNNWTKLILKRVDTIETITTILRTIEYYD